MDNPWHRLPDSPPYVLPEDSEQVLAFNEKAQRKGWKKRELDLGFIPEPFVGRPDAPVLLLGNNPGVKDRTPTNPRRMPAFAERMRNNLLHRLSDEFPFLYLDPNPPVYKTNREWWTGKLTGLIKRFGDRVVARSILAVEFFPYVSEKFGCQKLALPSQQYSFELVRSAIKRQAVIVLTRGERWWLKAVPELREYGRLVRLAERQRARVSPGNCVPPGRYEEIVAAIEQAPWPMSGH